MNRLMNRKLSYRVPRKWSFAKMKGKCFSIFILVLAAGFSCSKEKVPDSDKIMARVGNRRILKKDFILRTEFTIRPKYPGKSDEELKRILLNNLIAEKMLAIEAEDQIGLSQNENFVGILEGIKEQKMREQLYLTKFYDQIKIGTQELEKVFKLAGREYQVAYFSIHKDSLAKIVERELLYEKLPFEKVYSSFTKSRKIPRKTVTFKEQNPFVVHDALYSEPLAPGTIVGPLKVNHDQYLVMQIIDWKDLPAISPEEIQIRWHEVAQKLREKKALQQWHTFVGELMEGKTIHFEKEQFLKLAEQYYRNYYQSNHDERIEILTKYWTTKDKEVMFGTPEINEWLLDKPFFTIDDKVWSVRDFREAVRRHPLVFREKTLDRKSFLKQFRLAIVDMMTDLYITKEAYKLGLDSHPEVRQAVNMWKDAYLAMHIRSQYLDRIRKRLDFNPEKMKGNENYFSIYVDSLQKKYSDNITIDPEILNDITLTKIDMIAFEPNVPFPLLAPPFPEYIFDGEFDYGRHLRLN